MYQFIPRYLGNLKFNDNEWDGRIQFIAKGVEKLMQWESKLIHFLIKKGISLP